jgi:hypothetical protein
MKAMAIIATLIFLLIAPHVAWPQQATPGYTMHQVTVPGSMETYVIAINDRLAARGDLLGYSYDRQWNPSHFVKYGSAYLPLDVPDLAYFEAQGLNNGRLVMGYGLLPTGDPTGFAYLGSSKEHTTKVLETLQHPDGEYTIATGVNDAGDIVGTYYGSGPGQDERPFILQDDVYADLPAVDGFGVYPSDINNLGVVVGTIHGFGGTFGFVYRDGSYTFFSHPRSGFFSVAGINDHGHLVGSYFVFEWADGLDICCWRGYLVKDGTYTTINVTGDAQTTVAGINNQGNLAGTFYRPGDGWLAHGFVAAPKPPPKSKSAKVATR